MILSFIHWIFRTVTPYLLGACIGIGFFFLLIHLISGPSGLVSVNNKMIRFSQSTSEDVVVASTNPTPDTPASPVNAALSGSEQKTSDEPVSSIVENLSASAVPPSEPTDQKSSETVEQQPQSPAELVPEQSVAGVMEKAWQPVVTEKRVEEAAAPGAALSPVDCGTPPGYPGEEMSRYMACQWRNGCLSAVQQESVRLSQGRKDCVMSGQNPIFCRDYFDALQNRFDPAVCNQRQAHFGRW
ncbi:MAG: hypothetical protein HQL67_04170 [Magnetococcales bacterium]|nr:hypothetical protein [Magnetococcales bacterium]